MTNPCRWKLRRAGRAWPAALAAWNAAMSAPSLAQDRGPVPPLRIASFDVSEAPGLAEAKPAQSARPSWRTSFGSEIRNETRRTLPGLAIDADVVLLQGLSSIREVRRLFPARDWKLVVSRQLLLSEDPLDTWAEDATAGAPTTAVAVRFQRGVRVSGQDHLMVLARPEAGLPGTKSQPAATAVRLNLEGRSVWLVSASLTPDCAADATGCPAHSTLERWRQERRDGGEAVISGGSLSAKAVPVASAPLVAPATEPTTTPPGIAVLAPHSVTTPQPGTVTEALCRQSIEADSGLAAAQLSIERHPVAGCLALLDLPR